MLAAAGVVLAIAGLLVWAGAFFFLLSVVLSLLLSLIMAIIRRFR